MQKTDIQRKTPETVSEIQDAYKLGFIHGAIAMLQYVKENIRRNNQLFENHMNRRKIRFVLRQLKNQVRSKTTAESEGTMNAPLFRVSYRDKYVYSYENAYIWLRGQYGKLCIKMAKPKDEFYQTEKEAINALLSMRRNIIIKAIQLYKRDVYNEKLNKKLKKI